MWSRRFAFYILIPGLLVLAGTVGYHLVEGWPLFDSLYMAVITLTTVGFAEVHPLSAAGRVFTMVLVLGGVFTLLFAAMEIIRLVVSGELQTALGRQRMERSLSGLKEHTIVCGYGRMGRLVAAEFSARGLPFVVVEKDPARLADFAVPHGIPLPGDAIHDDVLRRAGIDRARALVTVLGNDADNLYITMSARLLNESVVIVARADEEGAEAKLRRAGATKVVSPYVISGVRVANAVVRPAVVEFIGSPLDGATPKDSRLRQDLGIMLVAIKKPAGNMVFNPGADCVMEPGDILIWMGGRPALDQLQALAAGSAATPREERP